VPILFDRGTRLHDYPDLQRQLSTDDGRSPVIEVLNLIGPVGSRKNNDTYVALKERMRDAFIRKDARKSVEMKIMESMRHGPGDAPAPSPTAATLVTPTT